MREMVVESLELLRQQISFTCWCMATQECYDAIDKIEEEIKELEEIKNYYEDLCS